MCEREFTLLDDQLNDEVPENKLEQLKKMLLAVFIQTMQQAWENGNDLTFRNE